MMMGMIIVNGFFAGYEIALASVSSGRLQVLLREGRRGAVAAQRMKRNMEGSLAACPLGMTLAAVIAGATGGSGAEASIAPMLHDMGIRSGLAHVLAITIVVLPLTALTVILGELVPKLFALRNKEWVCLTFAPAASAFASIAWPLVWFLESTSTTVMRCGDRRWGSAAPGSSKSEAAELQELQAIAELARTARLIGAKEENIILGAARLSGRQVREIALPAKHISMLDLNASVGDCLSAAHLDMHNRFPVTERAGDPQAIVGYVNFKDMVAQLRLRPNDPSLRTIVRTIPKLAEDLPISEALESLMREHTHIALVRDSTDKVVGMITLEDVIEELVGDIQDEFDLLPTYALASQGGWEVGGGISLNHLLRLTGVDLASTLPPSGAQTVSGWVTCHLGRPARGGDVVRRGNARVLVRKVWRNQVQKAQIKFEAASDVEPL